MWTPIYRQSRRPSKHWNIKSTLLSTHSSEYRTNSPILSNVSNVWRINYPLPVKQEQPSLIRSFPSCHPNTPIPPRHPINLQQVPKRSIVRLAFAFLHQSLIIKNFIASTYPFAAIELSKKKWFELRNADINAGSIIDIYHTASKMVALLVHNDFAPKAITLLPQKKSLHPIKNFYPLVDPVHLADPNYKGGPFFDERT